MRDPIEDLFGEEAERYYPGSATPIPTGPPPPEPAPAPDGWDASPMVFIFNGVETEFFTVGQLAKALGKSASTVREWERFGHLPLARYRTRAVVEDKKKRLYTRAQVEGLVRIAGEEGLLVWKPRNIRKTNFAVRATQLFRDLEQ